MGMGGWLGMCAMPSLPSTCLASPHRCCASAMTWPTDARRGPRGHTLAHSLPPATMLLQTAWMWYSSAWPCWPGIVHTEPAGCSAVSCMLAQCSHMGTPCMPEGGMEVAGGGCCMLGRNGSAWGGTYMPTGAGA